MAATVTKSRKRGPDTFLDDDLFGVPSDAGAAPLAKRGRCSPLSAAVADLGIKVPLELDPIEALQLIFPDADREVLQGYFKASGNVLDAAITTFKNHIANRSTESDSPLNDAPSGSGANHVTSSEVDVPAVTSPTNVYEWAELVANEMSIASDMIDAKNRAFRILEEFAKSTVQVGPDSELIQQNKTMRLMLRPLLIKFGSYKNIILKLQYWFKNYHEMLQERAQSKQVIEKYEKQIKALEDKNYVLSFHLQQANQYNSISSYRNPDIF